MKITQGISIGFITAALFVLPVLTSAAPLAPGTALHIAPGNLPGGFGFAPCTSGSCIGWFIAPGFYAWSNVTPGTDGGFIVGKSQVSGGQEIDRFSTNDGELTAAFHMSGPWMDFTQYTTLYTMPGGPVNLFDDTSCTKAACLGKTELRHLYAAHNGSSIPLAGSAAACLSDPRNCTADQKAGIFVNNYTIDLVGNTWSMDYASVVPAGSWSNALLHIIFRGTVVPVPPPLCPVVDYAWPHRTERSILVFGSNFLGVTRCELNGIPVPCQPLGDDILWLLPFDPVTWPSWPWKPGTGTIEVFNGRLGCSSKYPRPCGT